MSINAITKYDQLIFSNFWDKGDQIIGSCCGPYADIIATTFLLLSNLSSLVCHSHILHQRSYQFTSQQPVLQHQYIIFTILPSHQSSWCTSPSYFLLGNASATFPSQPLMVPTFKLPNLNFFSVLVVPDHWMTIWQCSWLTSALAWVGPSSVTLGLLTHLWFSNNKTIIEILEQVFWLYALTNTNQFRGLELSVFIEIPSLGDCQPRQKRASAAFESKTIFCQSWN